MKRIILRCPTCLTQRMENIPDILVNLRKSFETALILLKVSKDIICSHSFYLEVDRNYDIRNVFTVDDLKRYYPGSHPPILTLK